MKNMVVWYSILIAIFIISAFNVVVPGVLTTTRFFTYHPATIPDELWNYLYSRRILILVSSIACYGSIILILGSLLAQKIFGVINRIVQEQKIISNLYPTETELVGKKQLIQAAGIDPSLFANFLDNKTEGYSIHDAKKLLLGINKMENNMRKSMKSDRTPGVSDYF